MASAMMERAELRVQRNSTRMARPRPVMGAVAPPRNPTKAAKAAGALA
jgi:hypothetical protein